MAGYYDAIYDLKLYEYEARCVTNLANKYLSSTGRRLLDVACGTGRHLEYLSGDFYTEGLDTSEDMLAAARRRNPEVTFHRADMTGFHLGRTFDVVTCLFGSLGYVKTLDNLARAVSCMAAHLTPGGMLLIEPWYTPTSWKPETVHAIFIDKPHLKVARICSCSTDARLAILDVHCLIGTPDRIEHRSERDELGLFEPDEIRACMRDAGLAVAFEEEGIGVSDKGVFVGCSTASVN